MNRIEFEKTVSYVVEKVTDKLDENAVIADH